jgi:hypothetical protein
MLQAFSVLFHDFTPFSFSSVSAQEVAEAVFSIKSEAIGLGNVSFKFDKLLAPSLIPHITNFFNFCFTTLLQGWIFWATVLSCLPSSPPEICRE